MPNLTETGLQSETPVDDERSYLVPKWRGSSVEKIYSEVLPQVAQSLSEASSTDEIFDHLQRVDELFMGSWEGEKVVEQSINYDDSPSESGAYRHLIDKAFLPVLSKLEGIGLNSNSPDRSAIVSRLEEYVQEHYEFHPWDFHRASELASSMLQIDGTGAFPSIRRVSEYITDTGNNPYFQELVEEYDEQHYSPAYLEFDDPEYRRFHFVVVEAIADHSWSGDERPVAARFLTEYLSVNSEGNLRAYVAAFEDLGIDNAAPYLLRNLKSDDVLTRRMSAEILFRLELGKVGVTEKGVEYLGKLYNLGKYNDPDFFVRRLNNLGLMAVLAKDGGNVGGVFPLDLYAEEGVIQVEVRQLMSQELFLPKADETPAQREQREEYLKLFLENYESIFNDEFFEDTGVRLNSLELHEQGWFLLNYLRLSDQENAEGLEQLRDFVTEYGEYGLKSFLALEYGGSGQEILEFAEAPELSKEEKLAVFKNFYAIANEALNWREVFGQVEAGAGYEFAPQVHEAFVRKNAEFFRAAQTIARGEGGDVTVGELLKNMNTVAFSLRALKGIYEDNSALRLEQKPQTQDEYDKDGNLVESASSSFILVDKGKRVRIVVSIRTQPTVRQGNTAGGEARINFSVTDLKTKERARIGFDLSDYGDFIGEADKPSAVSLDLGVGQPDREAGIWPSQRVGRVLELAGGSEGGHNELSFKPEVAEHFPKVAKRFKGYIESRFVEQG